MCLKQGQSTVTQAITRTMNNDKRLAPEIEAGRAHSAAADIWALGQILYKLLFALNSEASDDTLAKSFNAEMTAEDEIAMLMDSCGNDQWRSAENYEVKELIAKMVLSDPTQRPNIIEVLSHSWFDSDI